MSSSSSASSLSDALTLGTNNQAFDSTVAMNGTQALPEPYEVTLPEIVVTPGSNNTSLADNTTLAEEITSAPSIGDTLTEATAQAETLNVAGDMAVLSAAQEKTEPRKKGFRGWLANKFQPLLASIGGTSAETKPYLQNLTGGNTLESVTSTSDTLNQSIGSYADNGISMPSMSESLSDATDITSTDNSQSQTFNSDVQQNTGGSQRNVTIDRVCDQIVINVENTDGQGADEIRSRILEVLNEIVEG